MSEPTDVMGTPMTQTERKLLEAYRSVEALARLDLPPTAHANVAEARAALWQAVNNLMLTDDRP